MSIKLLSALLLIIVVGYLFLKRDGDISVANAKDLVRDGARLVDVRTPAEFASGHIAGAINIPLQQLDHRMSELQPKERPVVLYCRSGNRSSRAAQMLRESGYTLVHDLGAMSRW